MAVKTPGYWKDYELIEETTAYGNKVMIPQPFQAGWEMERLRQQHMEKKGQDLNEYLAGLQQWILIKRPRGSEMYQVFWEIYQGNE